MTEKHPIKEYLLVFAVSTVIGVVGNCSLRKYAPEVYKQKETLLNRLFHKKVEQPINQSAKERGIGEEEARFDKRFDGWSTNTLKSRGIKADIANSFHARYNGWEIAELIEDNVPAEYANKLLNPK